MGAGIFSHFVFQASEMFIYNIPLVLICLLHCTCLFHLAIFTEFSYIYALQNS